MRTPPEGYAIRGESRRRRHPVTRLSALYLLPACVLFSQAPAIIQGPYVASVTRSSAVISWTTNIGSTTKIKSGYSDGAWTHVDGAFVWDSDSPIRTHTWYTSGLNANSTIYYQVCSTSYAGQVGAVGITSGGSGYAHPPTLTFSGGGGYGATAIATVSGGAITAVTVTGEGYYYTSAPTLTITPTGGDTPTAAVLVPTYIATATEGCSPTGTFTTLSQSVVPALPTPPTPVDAPVIPTGTVHTVAANCNDAINGLVALWGSVPRGDIVEIDPAITPYCTGLFTFPARADGPPYILTRVKNASTTFPGYRRASPSDAPTAAGFASGTNKMARFIHNAPNVSDTLPLTYTTGACFAGEYAWVTGQSNHWAMYRCRNTKPQSITAITITSDNHVRLTIPSHGLSALDGFSQANMIGITGVTGSAAPFINGGWAFTVIDSSTIQLANWFGYSWNYQAVTGSASGGTVYLNQYQLEPVTEGAIPPPSTCNFGDWYHETYSLGTEDEYHRTYYCHEANSFIPYRIDVQTPDGFGLGYNTTLPVIDLVSNHPNYLMFQGLSFEPMKLKTDAAQLQYQYSPATNAVGNTYNQFVAQGDSTHHIYWDNILANCPDPDPANPNGVMVRCGEFASQMEGSNWHVGGSYFGGFQIYSGTVGYITPDSYGGVFFMVHTGPHEFINNYIGCAGICMIYPEDDASSSWATDGTLQRNTFETPDKYWMSSPSWLGNGMWWSRRHNLEWKRGKRMLVEGNQFIGGWAAVNSGAHNCLCTRGGADGAQVQTISGAAITTYAPTAANKGYQLDMAPGDMVAFNNNFGTLICPEIQFKMFTVTAVSTDKRSITVSPSTGCAGGGGNIVGVNRDSNNISDLLITNNTYLNGPQDFYVMGHGSYPGVGTGDIVSTIMTRVALSNNLSIGVDSARVGIGDYCSALPCNPFVFPTGSHLTLLDGNEDLTITYNTVMGRTGGAYFAPTSSFGLSSGLNLSNNLFESISGDGADGPIQDQGTYFGNAALASAFSGLPAPYSAPNNVVLRANGSSGIYYPMPAGTLWYDTTVPFLFVSAAQSNYRLRSASVYSSGGSNRSTDGFDNGVDMDSLEAAQGKVSNVRAFDISRTSATVGFLAPDSAGCRVDWSTDNFATYIQTIDAGGNRVRNIVLSGLPSHSAIQYRVNCATIQPVGAFITTP